MDYLRMPASIVENGEPELEPGRGTKYSEEEIQKVREILEALLEDSHEHGRVKARAIIVVANSIAAHIIGPKLRNSTS